MTIIYHPIQPFHSVLHLVLVTASYISRKPFHWAIVCPSKSSLAQSSESSVMLISVLLKRSSICRNIFHTLAFEIPILLLFFLMYQYPLDYYTTITTKWFAHKWSPLGIVEWVVGNQSYVRFAIFFVVVFLNDDNNGSSNHEEDDDDDDYDDHHHHHHHAEEEEEEEYKNNNDNDDHGRCNDD